MLGRHSLLCSRLVLALLLLFAAACDKKVIRERVRPSGSGGTPTRPIQDLDGSVIVDDAGAGDDASEPDELIEGVEREFTKANLIAALGECALAAYRVFERRAQSLSELTSAWEEEPSEANALAAREAFRRAMDALQRVELFRFGPLAATNEPGGKGLREEIYAYPHTNLCKVDQQIVDQAYARGDFAQSVATARGLAALEYLDYYEGAQNSCSSAITINVNGSWAALSTDELRQRRRAYAGAIARDVAKRASDLVSSFAPGADDFLGELKSAGRGSKVYASEQAALNAISNALFYVDIEVKDYKLALPLGISPDCSSGTICPEAVESPFAGLSTRNLARNLAAFRAVFQGCAVDNGGLGFDDWLAAVGKQDLANAMLAALSRTEAAVQALDPQLERALVEDRAKVQVVYDALKGLTDLLKTEFVAVLDLGLPRVAEGDND